jgi:hypothetical protein
MSTQKPQPLTWLARSLTSSMVENGTGDSVWKSFSMASMAL